MQNFKLSGLEKEFVNEYVSNKIIFEEITSLNKNYVSSRSIKSDNRNFFNNELKTVFNYLNGCIATASMVSAVTEIPQKNICRYKRLLEKAGLLWEVKNEKCMITGYKAWYLTTNEKYISRCRQLNLFD